MTVQRYRLKSSTLAIMLKDGQQHPVTVPVGSIVQARNGSLDGDRLIDVEWDGRTVSMFSIDLRDRGENVE